MRPLDGLIISTGRAGSTAVYSYLNELGDLGLPRNKEPHFWCDVERYDGTYPALEALYVAEEKEYESLYDGSERLIDASVGYFFCIDEVLAKLEAYGQAPPVVFLYREPVSRASSLYNELRKTGTEMAGTLAGALALAEDREPGLWWARYYDNVGYATVFAKLNHALDRVLAIGYDEFSRDPAEAMRLILNFLDIEPAGQSDYRPMNTSSEARLSARTKRFQSLKKLLPSWVTALLKNAALEAIDRRRQRTDDLTRYVGRSLQEYQQLQVLLDRSGSL